MIKEIQHWKKKGLRMKLAAVSATLPPPYTFKQT